MTLSVSLQLASSADGSLTSLTGDMSRIAFAAQIATLFLAARLRSHDDDFDLWNNVVGIVGANALAVLWLSIEAQAIGAETTVHVGYSNVPFAISAIWGLYAGVLLVAGVALRSRTCRILSVCLFGLTLVKMIISDLWLLPQLQRLIGFIGIGALLIVCSLTYQRFKTFVLERPPEGG